MGGAPERVGAIPLASLYGATTKRFDEQVRLNAERFPADSMFRLSGKEL